MRRGRIAGVPHAPQHIPAADTVAGAYGDGTRRQVGEPGPHIAAAQDHVIAEHPGEVLRRRSESKARSQDEEELLERMIPLALRYALHRDDDLAVERRVDGSPQPWQRLVGTPAEQHPQRPTWVGARALLGVEPDQVERIPLTQDVRSVARDAIAGVRTARHSPRSGNSTMRASRSATAGSPARLPRAVTRPTIPWRRTGYG